jgi:hypothetical protein
MTAYQKPTEPRCAGCLVRVEWPPTYTERGVYCCETCALGHECVCNAVQEWDEWLNYPGSLLTSRRTDI